MSITLLSNWKYSPIYSLKVLDIEIVLGRHEKIHDCTKMPQKATEANIRIVPFNVFILIFLLVLSRVI